VRLLPAVACAVTGCGTASDIEEIRRTQEEILTRLVALERNDQALLSSLRSGQVPNGPEPTARYEIAIGPSPSKGARDAPVAIVGFIDFECPFSRSSVKLLRDVLAAYPGQVRLVVKQFPLAQLHRDAQAAAKAALAAHRQGKFWEMHDLLFRKQHALEFPRLKRYAQTLALDVDRFEADMASAELEAELRADLAEGRRARVAGTPTFFVNGRRVAARSFEAFRTMIEDALAAGENARS
jgi:protein-disulfide isomerase